MMDFARFAYLRSQGAPVDTTLFNAPFNGAGQFNVFTPGTPFVTGTTISSSVCNSVNSDFATGLSTAITKDAQTTTTAEIPFAQGIATDDISEVTSGAGVTFAQQVNFAASSIASASPMVLNNLAANTGTITGTTGFSAVTLTAGSWRLCKFDDVLTMTHGANLVLPGAANITTAAGDLALFVGYPSSVVRVWYQKASGNAVASAPFPDTTAIVKGSADASKLLRFEVDGLTASTTRVITMPDKDVTLADATDLAGGLIELATLAEVQAGTDATRAVTASTLQNGKIIQGTAQASTSGVAIDYTGIPSWAKRVHINFAGFSTSGTSVPIIQIGDAGGIEPSGYLGAGSTVTASANSTNFTTGFGVRSSWTNTLTVHGTITLSLLDAATNTWVANGALAASDVIGSMLTEGSKSLSATLDRVRITTVGGSDTFDAGLVNIQYE